MTDYITDAGVIHWDRAEPFIKLLGEHEHEVFKNRINEIEHKYKDRIVTWDSTDITMNKSSNPGNK